MRGQTLARELLDRVAHALGKRFDERTAARGTSLVEHDGVDGVVADLEAFDILTADVENEVDVLVKELRGGIVRHRLDQTIVDVEGFFDQLLAVARDRTAADGEVFAEQLIYLHQLFLDDGNGIALVGAVVGVDDVTAIGHDDELCGGGAAVDADIRVALVVALKLCLNMILGVAGNERLIVVSVLEERRQRRHRLAVSGGAAELFGELFIVELAAVRGVQRRADRDGIESVVGKDGVSLIEPQRLDKALSESLAVVERAAEEHDLAVDAASLCQPRDGLVDDRLIDRGGDVRLGRALIDQRLDIGLCEDAAARRDRIDLLVLKAQRIHLGV